MKIKVPKFVTSKTTIVIVVGLAVLIVAGVMYSKQQEYRLVDPEELSFELQGFSSRSIIQGGRPVTVGGTVGQLLCEGKPIELQSHTINGEFIETKEYGKIKVEFSSSLMSSSFAIWLKPAQKKALMALKP